MKKEMWALRLSEKEKQALRLISTYDGVSMTSMVRQMIRERADKYGYWARGHENQKVVK